jgi:intein-encoded DNA endonuclease-like protein
MTKAYLLGALHDATERKTTYRIAQKSRGYINFLAKEIKSLNRKAWIYQEGKSRNLFIVEFSKSFLKDVKLITRQDKIDYIRGYFDTEGGLARSVSVRYYIYFAQKNFDDLKEVKFFLEDLNISCGKMHNPSKKVDPNYWRFFIRAKSYRNFAQIIGSWHPVKSRFLRMKI